MFSHVDKMIVAAIGTGVTFLVGGGFLSAEEGAMLTNIVVTLLGAGITGLATWLWPNKV